MSSDLWKSVRQRICPVHRRRNYSANYACKLHMRIKQIQGLSLWNTDHARRVPTFKSMFQLKKYLVRKFKHTLISKNKRKSSISIILMCEDTPLQISVF